MPFVQFQAKIISTLDRNGSGAMTTDDNIAMRIFGRYDESGFRLRDYSCFFKGKKV